MADDQERGGSTDDHHSPSRRRTDTAKRLMDATIAAIDQGGEAAVRVQDIADSASTAIPVLYRHFGSRDGLIQAAQVERLSRALVDEVRGVQAVVDTLQSAEQFRALFDVVLASLDSPERRLARWKRINILGSTYGRPVLAEAISELQSRSIGMVANIFRGPQAKGWLRDGLDVDAFAAWFAGQTLGRVLIEIGATGIDGAAWNQISGDAVRYLLFGPPDPPPTTAE